MKKPNVRNASHTADLSLDDLTSIRGGVADSEREEDEDVIREKATASSGTRSTRLGLKSFGLIAKP